MIIIIGSNEEYHAKYIFEKLQQENTPAKYFDSRKYPIFSWSPDGVGDYIILENEKIYLKDISGIYWRWYYGVTFSTSEIVYREKVSALESMLCALEPVSWNSLQAVELHRKKGLQSKIMQNNGIRIPKTTVTDDKDMLEKFYLENDKNVIFKPVRGGAYTKKLTEQDLERKESLKNCPCQLQECIDGLDIRVYAFETGEIYAGEIHAQSLDFRADTNAKINKHQLPESVQKDCLKILKLLNLKYSGIDIRLKENGEYVFIEANPAPMFIHFENVTGFEITNTLIKNLKGNR